MFVLEKLWFIQWVKTGDYLTNNQTRPRWPLIGWMTDCVYSLIPLVYTGESIDYLPIKWQNDKNIESKYWHCSQLVPGEVFVNCNFGLWGAGLTLTIYNVINYTQQWGNDCVIVSCNRISLMPQLLISGWSKHFPYFVIYSYWPW